MNIVNLIFGIVMGSIGTLIIYFGWNQEEMKVTVTLSVILVALCALQVGLTLYLILVND